jgi:hypothetical protein
MGGACSTNGKAGERRRRGSVLNVVGWRAKGKETTRKTKT